MGGRSQPLAFGEVDPRADQVMVPMRDGIRLATDVYLPARKRSTSAILVRLPYDKSAEFAFMPHLATRLLEDGYAVVVQDVRGKVRSEGVTRAFASEVLDGFDTLDWLTKQPWSDGKVGTFGDSYYGYTQWASLTSQHPAIRAMVPRMTSTRVAHDWMFLDGVFNLGTMGEWALHTWIDNHLNDLEMDWQERPLAAFIENNAGGQTSKSWNEWLQHGPNDPFWEDLTLHPSKIPFGTVPTLHVGGWFDVFSRGQLADFAQSLKGSRARDQHLIMAAADHFDDSLTSDGYTPDYSKDPVLLEHFLDSYLRPAQEFYGIHLRDLEGDLPRVSFQAGNGLWHSASQWPPAGSTPTTLHLSGSQRALTGPHGGSLTLGADTRSRSVSWLHSPSSPVPSLITDPWRPLLHLPDERPAMMRPDVATFTTEEYRLSTTIAGPVQVEAWLTADAPSTMLVGRLCDVFPDGRTHLIVEGVTWVDQPSSGAHVRINLGDTAYVVRPGHRLTLQISTSCFPRWPIHPGTAEDPMTASTTRNVPHHIEIGGSRPAFLHMHLFEPER